jgi:hypothetical protein
MDKDFHIVKTHPDLITYIDHLQKKNAEQLSFYPKQVFEREADKGRLFLGMLNGQPGVPLSDKIDKGYTSKDIQKRCHFPLPKFGNLGNSWAPNSKTIRFCLPL